MDIKINDKFDKLTVVEIIHRKNKALTYKCLCDCGNFTTRTKDHLLKSKWCKECQYASQRLSITYVKRYFQAKKCVLLEDNYINASTKMKYLCACGRESSITFNSFQSGTRCKACGYNNRNQKGSNNHAWNKDRQKVLDNTKFRLICKNLLNRSLKNNPNKKTTNTYKMLGYTPEELINHITSHPNWNSIKNTKWSIDHIFPIKAFMEYEIYDIKIINSLENLQPMSFIENSRKKDKYNPQDFEKFLRSKGIIV